MGERISHKEWLEYQEKFEAFLKEHPIEIPSEMLEKFEATTQEFASPNLSFERFKELSEEDTERKTRLKTPDATLEDKYWRFYQLTKFGTVSKGELAKLQAELSPCYCGSGKTYKQCHGM